jgi:hypothetical protein
MPYRTYTNPDEQYAGTAFDPYTGRLNGAQLVMQWMARREAEKQKKQQAQWDIEDRELRKRYVESQIAENTKQPAPPKMTEPEFKVWLYENKPDVYKKLYPEPLSPKEKAKQEALGKGEAEKELGVTEKPTKPTAFDQKKAFLDAALKRGDITPEQHREALAGVNMPPTPQTTATSRRLNNGKATSMIRMASGGDPKNYDKPDIETFQRGIQLGVRMDLPVEYNAAKLNIEDGIATKEDEKLVQDIEGLQRFFIERGLPMIEERGWKKARAEFMSLYGQTLSGQLRVIVDKWFKNPGIFQFIR